MRIIISMGLLFVPCMAIAFTDCRINDFQDHSELVCIGDEKAVPGSSQIAKQAVTAVTVGKEDPARKDAQQKDISMGPGAGRVPKAGVSTNQETTDTASAAASVPEDPVYGPRSGRMSKSRVEAAINARNKVLQNL